MTPAEIDRFIKEQLNMGARIAQKANRARIGAAAFTNVKSSPGPSLGDRIIAALDRPGVAPSSRPLSKEGAQTFHFALTTVSRTSEYASKMKNNVAGKAGDHMGYVERDGAAETLAPDIKREADEIDREAWAILGGQEYIERPNAAEVLPDGRTHASFGNIAATLEERIDFWRALEEAAPKPKTHGIVADRTQDPDFWDRVDRDPGAPATLRAIPQWIALPVDQSAPDAAKLNRPIPVPRVSDKEAIAVAQYAAKHRSRMKNRRPAVTIDPGRGGRIQNRIIVELPHELSADDRLAVAKAFCFKHFVEGRAKPLPHWCVIHKPDHHNDARNTHMHIMFAERPATRMNHPETGEECWDFQIQLKIRDEAKHVRLKRPFEQPPDRSLQDRSWVKNARKSYAEIANAALKAAGKSKIYDERTYKAMGIDVDPRKRINGKDYVNEKKGVSTPAGTPAVLEQWRREEERLSKRHPSFEPDPDVIAKFNCEIRRWWRSSTSTKYKLMILRHEWTIAQAHRKYYAAEAAANALIMRKIKSKLAPPLGTDARLTKDATDYLKMFKADLIDKHHQAAAAWKRNERYVLTSLRQAQRADPKVATGNDFLGGGAVLQAMNGMMTQSRLLAASRPATPTFELAKTIMDTTRDEANEKRAIRRSLEAVRVEREGRPEQYPGVAWNPPAPDAAEPVPAAGMAPGQSPSAIPTPATLPPSAITQAPASPAPATEPAALQVPAAATIPRWGADGVGRFPLPPLTSNTPPPPPVGDEIRMTFLSDTGAPVQRRVYSPTRIRETEARADAIIAASKKRQAEREATYKAARAAEERHARTKAFFDAHPVKPPGQRPNPAAPTATAPGIPPASTSADVSPAGADASAMRASTPTPKPSPEVAKADPTPAPVATAGTRPAAAASRGPGTPRQATGPAIATTRSAPSTSAPPDADRVLTTEGKAPLLDDASTVYQPNTIPKPPVASTTAATTPTEDRTQTPEGIDLADIEVTDAPPKKKKPVMTAEQLHRRALLAAKDRGRGR